MERTQSCSDFKENCLCHNDNHHLSTVKTLENQQQQHQQQQQQLSQLHFKTYPKPMAPYTPPTMNAPLRKKRLQRQKSTVYSGDETEYAADLEEDGDEEDEGYSPASERDLNLNLPSNAAALLSNQKKKQVRFRGKQQSESCLRISAIHSPNTVLDMTTSSSSLTSSLNSSDTTSSGSHERRLKSDGSFDSVSELPQSTSGCSSGGQLQLHKSVLKRDNSMHSDSSRYSSVDSLLESRKPDPEAILINLGFGPPGSEDILSRIPKRFLKPSQVRGIDTDAFIKRLQLAHTLADHSVLGYRGLTGNPDVPPSHIVAKIMQRFEVNERKKSLTSMELKLR